MAIINYDVAIIGSGVAGTFAALKLAKDYKCKVILFDLGAAPGKRRQQCNGFLGCFPTGDGKLYLSDLNKISKLIGPKQTNVDVKWFNNYVRNIFDMSVVKDPGPKINLEKRIKKSGFIINKNDYIQIYPREIHSLSKKIVNDIEDKISLSFDDEVLSIKKNKKQFTIISSSMQVNCKKVIICTGRSGWRWTRDLYHSFDLIKDNDIAKFGIRIETTSNIMKDFNKSNCSLINDDIELGPISWSGTVIPEDHIDMAISSFRSNEVRWKTDKVSFNLIGNRYFENNGFEQTNRLGQLTFILSNERIIKEKISYLLANKSKISIIPEYNWLPSAIKQIGSFLPDIISKGYFHIPTIIPVAPKINITNNMETDIDNMYCAGESAGLIGIYAAAVSGLSVASSALK